MARIERYICLGVIARTLPIVYCALLLACQQPASSDGASESFALEDTGPRQAMAMPSPDTSDSSWSVAQNGRAIHFGDAGETPWMTLACDLGSSPPALTVIRHAQAFPGQSALFPVIGNGMRSRFLADAVLGEDNGREEWRWEARLPANDPQLDVFEGTRDLTATLPGRGMLEISGSRIPGEFVDWCRTGGRSTEPVIAQDGEEESESAEAE